MQEEVLTGVLASPVSKHMSRDVATVLISDTLDLVVARMRSLRISGVPVLDPHGKLAGVVSEIDVARSLAPVKGVESLPAFLEVFLRVRHDEGNDPFQLIHDRLRHLRVGSCMSSPAITVEPTTTLGEAARLLGEQEINRLPVTDPEGKLLGILTRGDLVHAVASALPEREARPAAARRRELLGVPA